jgi:hypothetical protein
LRMNNSMKKSRNLTIILCLALILPALPAYASDSGPVQAPVISPASGNYLGETPVTITSTYGAVYYTTDGSNPAASRTAVAYSDSLILDRSKLIIAAAHGSSGWSSAVTATFNIGGPFRSQPDTSGTPAPQEISLRLTALSNKSGQTVVSVVYSGDPGADTGYGVTISTRSGNVIGTGKLTTDNTGVLIGPLEEGVTYQISVKQPTSQVNQYYGTFSIRKNALDKERLNIDQKLSHVGADGVHRAVVVPASSAPPVGSGNAAGAASYAGYHGDGSLIFNGFSSIYKAIDAVSTWENGAYAVEGGSNSRVFTTKNSPPVYHLYQHIAYFGSTTSQAAATTWANSIPGSHVIDGIGRFVMNSYNSTDTPDSWALEPRSGGYAYKYSFASSTYRTVYTTVELTKARLAKSTERARAYNAYIYLAAQNRYGTAEGGLVCLDYGAGDWYLYYKLSDTPLPTVTSKIVTGSAQSGNHFTPSADVELEFSYTDGSFIINARNLKTNEVFSSGVIADGKVGGSSVLISTASYVPISQDFTHTPDYQAGGHFKNVRFTKNYLGDVDGGIHDFSLPGGTVHYALEYNDDFCKYTWGDSWDEISIAYDGDLGRE